MFYAACLLHIFCLRWYTSPLGKPLRVEVGFPSQEKRQARHPLRYTMGRETHPCLEDESWGMTQQSGGALAALKAFYARIQCLPGFSTYRKGGTMLSLISQFRRPTRVLVALTITLF